MLAEQLADGRAFLTGERPGLADANSYYNLWFVRSAYPPATTAFDDLPHIGDWLERVRAIGHGERSEVSREAALDIAHKSEPLAGNISAQDVKYAGQQVNIAADDYGRDEVRGELVGSSEHHIAVRREDPIAGQVVVHFPRIGYSIQC